MSEGFKERLINLFAAALGWGIGHFVFNRFLDLPEEKGVADDVEEALFKAGTSVAATAAASIIVRRIL